MTETEQFVDSISYHCFEFVFLVIGYYLLFAICNLEFPRSIGIFTSFRPASSIQYRVLITAWAVFENRDGWAPDPVPSPSGSDSSNISGRRNVPHPDS